MIRQSKVFIAQFQSARSFRQCTSYGGGLRASRRGLGFHVVVMLFLDDRSPVDRLALHDDGGTVAIAISIVIAMALADGHADTDRSDANTDLPGHRKNGERADRSGVNNSFLMVSPFRDS